MAKVNCWEFKKCGREPGGGKVAEMGVCPAATDASGEGLNGGKFAGRICWAVAGTFCGGKVQGSFAEKEVSCMACEFYQNVRKEQGTFFQLMKPGQARLHAAPPLARRPALAACPLGHGERRPAAR